MSGESNQAVAPVIGVTILVGIVVILSAVVGVFVIGIGDLDETAPSTSFSTDEQSQMIYNRYYGEPLNSCSAKSGACLNVTVPEISHTGGDPLDVTSFDVVVNGNDSVYGIQCQPADPTGGGETPCEQTTGIEPTPDFRDTLGESNGVMFTSGQSMRPFLFSGHIRADTPVWGIYNERLAADANVQRVPYYGNWRTDGDGERRRVVFIVTPDNAMPGLGLTNVIENEDDVTVVWTASSGGKTQTLYSYSVQGRSYTN